MEFEKLNLHPNLLRAVEACGFKTPTEIQRQAIPVVLTGSDLMASAQTGTGKTAAFVLPTLQRLLDEKPGKGAGPRVLILTPTRELAGQVLADIHQFNRFSRLTCGSVLGGMSYGPQIRLLEKPLDILVATPGRLLDHMQSGRVSFSRLQILILDEADRMLDMGFINDIKKIAAQTPAERQTLLFSATLEGAVLDVAKRAMRNPQRIQLTNNTNRHEAIEQRFFPADDPHHKHRLLEHCLRIDGVGQTLVFTATKRAADKIAKSLASKGHTSAPLHGDMRQNARKRTIDHMKRGGIRVLVATDVAARGLDIKGITHVINFDLPTVAEDYIHRIGRTGRAGEKGTALSLVGPRDWEKLADIEKLTGNRYDRETVPGLEPTIPEPRRGQASGGGGKRPGKFNRFSRPGGFRKARNGFSQGRNRDWNPSAGTGGPGNGSQPRKARKPGRSFPNSNTRAPRKQAAAF